jgi:SOS response regulatory protein OraA/RecX
VNEIYRYALGLLKNRDYTVAGLRKKLAAKFEDVPEEVFAELISRNFLNDVRFSENYVANRLARGKVALQSELAARGVSAKTVEEVLSRTEWPSLREALAAKMNVWKLRVPLQSRDAARLYRALVRLGYDEDAIREEIEQIHEQQ